MVRTRTISYLLALALASGGVFTAMTAAEDHSADAAKKKKKKKAKAKKKKLPPVKLNAEQKKARAELIGSFQFGMTKDQVVAAFSKQLDERYAELIKETEDIATQDRLRKEKAKEVQKFKKSWVEFKGQKSGWDVSIVDEQFKHNVDEAMLEYWENQGGKNQRRFFFFDNGELYKMFIQVDINTFEGEAPDFDTFAAGMKSRYGARIWDVNDQTDLSGEGGGDIGVRILDKSRFHDAYCMIIFDPKRASDVVSDRKERIPEEKSENKMLEAIKDDGSDVDLNSNKDAVQGAIKEKKSKD